MSRYYAFFFISGFCSVLYELVWLRLAMAEFGVTTPLVSMVLSLFMAGLGLGSWVAGRWLRKYGARVHFPRLRLYAAVELLIGASAILVPHQLRWGHELLLDLGGSSAFSSGIYYLLAGGLLLLTLVPWCACMGATFPLGMFALGGEQPHQASRSFSYLYLANVLGAAAGAVFPLLLIEKFGFSGTLRVGGLLNVSLACTAFVLAKSAQTAVAGVQGTVTGQLSEVRESRRMRWLLFATGLTSMGMEVVWIRMFTPYLGTVVYSFASILAVYLMATFLGTRIYRRWRSHDDYEGSQVWLFLALGGLMPLWATDPTVPLLHLVRLAVGVVPFAMAAGFATPMLVDHESQGDPDRAASAYAVNVLGCIVGPLLSGFVLLPAVGERLALVVLVVPWLMLNFVPGRPGIVPQSNPSKRRKMFLRWVVAVAGCVLFFSTKGYEGYLQAQVLRDHTATVIATGMGRDKHLLVNGVGITGLTPITKMMAHLPLAFVSVQEKPQIALVICFGMGTTHRSALSWGIHSTAVELVPSVPQLFSYFHADGNELLKSPRSLVIIDDGRRYLELTREQYDVITIDPPPPVEAAGSSLLYSREFYALAKQRLRTGGILQQWLPGADNETTAAVARALKESFPYVRAFHPLEMWGVHFLASMQAIPVESASVLASQLPREAVQDILEWGPENTAERQFDRVVRNEISIDQLIATAPGVPALQDDRPINEYYLLRRGLFDYRARIHDPHQRWP